MTPKSCWRDTLRAGGFREQRDRFVVRSAALFSKAVLLPALRSVSSPTSFARSLPMPALRPYKATLTPDILAKLETIATEIKSRETTKTELLAELSSRRASAINAPREHKKAA